ncbi:MAG: hypothetical protein WDM78_11910 [Puia sp.]
MKKALRVGTTHRFDYLNHYVDDLKNVINLDVIRGFEDPYRSGSVGRAPVFITGPPLLKNIN